MTVKKIAKVTSLADLRQKALVDPAYVKLAIDAATNLGGGNITTLEQAMRWLRLNADETDSERGVVDEVNFVR